MYSFVNKDLPIGGGLEMPTLSIQVREGVRVWDMEKRAHHFIGVLNKINVVPMRRGGFKQCLRGSRASSPSTLLFMSELSQSYDWR